MPIRDNSEHWGAISIGLHWLSFLLVVAVGLIGWLMTDMPTGMQKIQVYALHKSFGLTVLALTAMRLLWRLSGRAPKSEPNTPAWQELIARLTHAALYILLLATSLSGWWFNSAAGYPLRWFGLFHLPAIASFDKGMKALARETHETLFYALAAVVAIHAAAALWHHYVVKDRTLIRMLPQAKTSNQGT
jgi:cytochrome b561